MPLFANYFSIVTPILLVVLQDKLVKGICRLCMLLQQSGHLSELRNLGAQMLSFCANNAHVREATTVYAIIKDMKG